MMNDDVPFDDYITYPDERRPYSRDHKCGACIKRFKTKKALKDHQKATQHTGYVFLGKEAEENE